MKKLLFLFFVFSASAKLPSEFYITEKFFSFPLAFDVSSDEPFIVARQQLFSLTPSFDLEDMDQNLIACSKARFLEWGIIVDVSDPFGNPIGIINEEIFRIFPWAEYKIFTPNYELIAIAKMNFWGTEFQLISPDNSEEIYATISRSFFRIFRDTWTVKVFEKTLIDPRVLILLAVYQTDKDNRDRYRGEFFNQISQELDYYLDR